MGTSEGIIWTTVSPDKTANWSLHHVNIFTSVKLLFSSSVSSSWNSLTGKARKLIHSWILQSCIQANAVKYLYKSLCSAEYSVCSIRSLNINRKLFQTNPKSLLVKKYLIRDFAGDDVCTSAYKKVLNIDEFIGFFFSYY